MEYVFQDFQATMLARYQEMMDNQHRKLAEYGTRFGAVIHSVQFGLEFEMLPFLSTYLYKYLGLDPRLHIPSLQPVDGMLRFGWWKLQSLLGIINFVPY